MAVNYVAHEAFSEDEESHHIKTKYVLPMYERAGEATIVSWSPLSGSTTAESHLPSA